MSVLSDMEPKAVFRFFEEISRIPRGSGHTKEISDYCVQFARERHLEAIQDGWNNVIIKKPGTKGYENSAPVILQGHLDMVCEKTEDSGHDFSKDPIEPVLRDGYVTAKDTTLGADNGIAVAMVLALLDSDSLVHPPIEAVFTADEETGMDGAANIDLSVLKGTMLLNLDSEEEDTLTAGCAGGFRFACTLPVSRQTMCGKALAIEICGLKGGHSGTEIHRQRGNANKLAGRLLFHLSRTQKLWLSEINGGTKDNVITSRNRSVILVSDPEKAVQDIQHMREDWKQEFGMEEPELDIRVDELAEQEFSVLTEESAKRVLGFLINCPNGVDEYSRSLAGQVETSDNLGVVVSEEKAVRFLILTRSGVSGKIEEFKERFFCLAEMTGGNWSVDSQYPAWTFKEHSRIRSIAADAFEEVCGSRPKIAAIHAGLECGLLSGKKPDLDCISFGPNILDAHSPAERLEIASTERVWRALQKILERCR